MYSLFFNIASHHKSIAVVDDATVRALRETEDFIGDAELIPLIEQTVADAGFAYNDLTHVACVVGPGGFTSLRVAVACANTYADQLQLPSAGIHLSDLLHAQSSDADHVWMHATKKDAVFIRGFGAHASVWPEPTLAAIEDLQQQLPSHAFWCGELLEEQQKKLQEKQLQNSTLKPLRDVLPTFLTSLDYRTDILLPWYGRGW